MAKSKMDPNPYMWRKTEHLRTILLKSEPAYINKLLDVEVVISEKIDGSNLGVVYNPQTQIVENYLSRKTIVKNEKFNGVNIAPIFTPQLLSDIKEFCERILEHAQVPSENVRVVVFGEFYAGKSKKQSRFFNYGEDPFWKAFAVNIFKDKEVEFELLLNDDFIRMCGGVPHVPVLFTGRLEEGIRVLSERLLIGKNSPNSDKIEGVIITPQFPTAILDSPLKIKVGYMDGNPPDFRFLPNKKLHEIEGKLETLLQKNYDRSFGMIKIIDQIFYNDKIIKNYNTEDEVAFFERMIHSKAFVDSELSKYNIDEIDNLDELIHSILGEITECYVESSGKTPQFLDNHNYSEQITSIINCQINANSVK